MLLTGTVAKMTHVYSNVFVIKLQFSIVILLSYNLGPFSFFLIVLAITSINKMSFYLIAKI